MVSDEDIDRREHPTAPLKPGRTILDQEITQAVEELNRPATGLFLSGLIAGFGLGASLFAVGVIATIMEGPLLPIVAANAYTVGFIIVIMGRTDLFTEYTTIAVLPVLDGQSSIDSLARMWGIVYVANLGGGVAAAGLVVVLGPGLGVISVEVFETLSDRIVTPTWWIIFLSSFFAGWLMGILSWLISSGRDTTSQILFIWMVAAILGLGHLHHIVTGTIMLSAGWFTEYNRSWQASAAFLLWCTIGNAMGGVLFAKMIHHSVIIRGDS